MEKFVRRLSSFISFVLVYVVGAYTYLSAKGFEYHDGTFTLVGAAQATAQPLMEQNGIAAKLDENMAFNFKSQPILGNENAPLTLYEFSSLGCTHCADFHMNILPRLKSEFIDTGKLNVVFINFPLEKKSMQGALLFECVPTENRHNYLNMAFARQREWILSFNSDKMLANMAAANGVNKQDIENCLKDDAKYQEIMANRQEAIDKLNVQGTPAFVISHNGQYEIIHGVPNVDELKNYLNQKLADRE